MQLIIGLNLVSDEVITKELFILRAGNSIFSSGGRSKVGVMDCRRAKHNKTI
jgi:hypothetical protein